MASMGIYVFNPRLLERLLRADADDPESAHDFGKNIVPGAIDKLRGAFTLLVWDRPRGEVLAFRDHAGLHPLYWAEGERGAVLFSPSIDLLLAQPGVRREINRAAIADHLSHRWPDKEETCFASIRRVPPGNVLRLTERDRRLERHWSPGMRDEKIDWIAEDDIGRFDGLFEQAVRRSAGGAATAISLSGGLDSISVAGVLTALLGGVMCFAQRHLKRLLAYSTISHMGLMLIGFGLLVLGLRAAARRRQVEGTIF